ncbi:hypothetical protein EGW08_014444, partial [Elysia chlorotica]
MKKDLTTGPNQVSTAMTGAKQTKSIPASEKVGGDGSNSISDKSKLLRNGHSEDGPYPGDSGHSENGNSGTDQLGEGRPSDLVGGPPENGHGGEEGEPVARTRAKTARPNGLRKSGKT